MKRLLHFLSSPATVGILTALAIGAVGFYFASRDDAPVANNATEGRSLRRETVPVGGVQRPASDVTESDRTINHLEILRRIHTNYKTNSTDTAFDPIGNSPKVRADANPAVMSVSEALRDRAKPERLTPMIAPADFDQQLYAADRDAYLNTVEPGRIWQTAQPAPGITPLRSVGLAMTSIKQGESVRLQVSAAPQSPVTFTSMDMGAFENRLISITVAADDNGIAGTVFTGTRGAVDDVHIVAGGPLNSGLVRFVVTVLPAVGN